MTESDLISKLLRIQALHSGATTAGEKTAAAQAIERVQARLREFEKSDPPVEYKFTLQDGWSRMLFMALVRRYGLKPFRYRRQRYTTVMVLVSKRFVDDTLWPEFQALDRELNVYLASVTERVIRDGLHGDTREADERDEPAALPGPV